MTECQRHKTPGNRRTWVQPWWPAGLLLVQRGDIWWLVWCFFWWRALVHRISGWWRSHVAIGPTPLLTKAHALSTEKKNMFTKNRPANVGKWTNKIAKNAQRSRWKQCPARVDIGISRSEKWNKNLFHSDREVKSEMKISFTLFENWKWKKIFFTLTEKWKVKSKSGSLFSRSEKWNKNASRSRSRSEILENFLKVKKLKPFCLKWFQTTLVMH